LFFLPSGLNGGGNDAGVIVGNVTLSGQTHAYRLTPSRSAQRAAIRSAATAAHEIGDCEELTRFRKRTGEPGSVLI